MEMQREDVTGEFGNEDVAKKTLDFGYKDTISF